MHHRHGVHAPRGRLTRPQTLLFASYPPPPPPPKGVQCTLDDSNEFMPGTKFKVSRVAALRIRLRRHRRATDFGNVTPQYWEQRGVKVRVELGPRDFRQHLITIATTTVPGRVADKETIKHISVQQVADHLKRTLASATTKAAEEETKRHVKFEN